MKQRSKTVISLSFDTESTRERTRRILTFAPLGFSIILILTVSWGYIEAFVFFLGISVAGLDHFCSSHISRPKKKIDVKVVLSIIATLVIYSPIVLSVVQNVGGCREIVSWHFTKAYYAGVLFAGGVLHIAAASLVK